MAVVRSPRFAPQTLRLEQLEGRDLTSSMVLPVMPGTPPGATLAVAGAGSPTVFAVGSRHELFRFMAGTGWMMVGGAGTIQSVTATTDASGMAVAFAVTTGGALARFDSRSGWMMIGGAGTVRTASAGTDSMGRADVFAVLTDNSLAEWRGSSGWLAGLVGGPGSVLQASALMGDRVAVVTSDHSVFEFDPRTGWFRLTGSGFAQSLSAVTDAFGREIVFVETTAGGLFRHDASGWMQVGGAVTVQAISAGVDVRGMADVFVVTTDDRLAEFDTTTGWMPLAPLGMSAEPAATFMDQVFVTLANGAVIGHSDTMGFFALSGPGFALE